MTPEQKDLIYLLMKKLNFEMEVKGHRFRYINGVLHKLT